MNIKKDIKYHLILPTSMGVRITPADRQPVAVSRLYSMQATSAESNAGSVAAALGMRVKVLSRFVRDSEIAAFIKRELRSRNIEYEGKDIPQGGPWGYRHQFNIADSGFGLRAPHVLNDRAGEVGRTISQEDYDFETMFGEEGVGILHMSGLFAAMSPETAAFCLAIAKAAKKHGTRVSFDLNYRATFWKGRETELRRVFGELAAQADILMGNEEDFQLALGIAGPEIGGGLSAGIDSFKSLINTVKRTYPNVTVFSTTLREVESANVHNWGAIVNCGDRWYVQQPRPIQVLDRIGGGDGFAAGMLYAILAGKPEEEWIKLGWACGALAVTVLEDFATPASEEEIWSIWKGNARVVR